MKQDNRFIEKIESVSETDSTIENEYLFPPKRKRWNVTLDSD